MATDHKMLRKVGRLFIVKTTWEASLIIYSLALGAAERGKTYLATYPGIGGYLLFLACLLAAALAGAKMFDCIRLENKHAAKQ